MSTPSVRQISLSTVGNTEQDATAEAAQSAQYTVQRSVLDYGTFDAKYETVYRRRRTLGEMAKDIARDQCGGCTGRHWIERLYAAVPFVNALRRGEYSFRNDLLSDVAAGVTTCVFHIPQGLAYGLLAGLKPINGLYTSLVPVLIFAVFGRSRHLSIGTFSLMALLLSDMIEANCEKYLERMASTAGTGNSSHGNNTAALVDYARLQTAVVGTFAASVILLVIGLLRLGFFMRYMSDAMLKGFTAAAAVQVVVSQLPLLLGIQPERTTSRFRIVASLINQVKAIEGTNFVTLGISAACCAVLYLVKEFVNPRVKKRIRVPLPIELIVIVITLLISHFASLHDSPRVDIVGAVPRGLPAPLVPDLGFLPTVFPSAIPVGIVGGAVTMSFAKLYCLEFQYSYDFNEDFAVLGISSLVASFFQCFFACGALARNSVVVSVGMKSQLASLISCVGMLLVLLVVGPFFESIPTCVLGSIIVVSLINVMSPVKELPQVYRASRIEFAVFVVSGLAVLVLDVTLGLAIGFGFTLLSVVLRTQTPATSVLGRVEDTDLYEDLQACPSRARPLSGVAILRFGGPLNFASAETFSEFAWHLGRPELAKSGDQKVDGEEAQAVHTVILDCSPWCYIDMVGVRTLRETCRQLTGRGYRVLLAACAEPLRSALTRQGLLSSASETTPTDLQSATTAAAAVFTIDNTACFPSLHDAALFAQAAGPQKQRTGTEVVGTVDGLPNGAEGRGESHAPISDALNQDSEGLVINGFGISQEDKV